MQESPFGQSEDFQGITFSKVMLVSEQILFYFVDFFRITNPAILKTWKYSIPLKEYDRFRQKNKIKFSREMYRLRQTGVIREYLRGKERMVGLTKKGRKRLQKYLISHLSISRPNSWDKKWRLVIFDIPDDKKHERENFRHKLEELGFLKLQESVYVYPFECAGHINYLKRMYFISFYVQYVLADRIETEIDLIKKFYDKGLVDKDIIKKGNKKVAA